MYEFVDIIAIGFVIGLASNYWKLIHAPNSKDVINSVFKGDGGCYMLKPIIVTC